ATPCGPCPGPCTHIRAIISIRPIKASSGTIMNESGARVTATAGAKAAAIKIARRAALRACVIRATSESAIAPRTATIAVNSQSGAKMIAASSAGRTASAVQTLVRSTQAMARAVAVKRAEAPLARLVGTQRLHELALAEVGPQGLCEVELGVGQLVQEKVRDALLARGPDQQVGIGQAGACQMALQHRL